MALSSSTPRRRRSPVRNNQAAAAAGAGKFPETPEYVYHHLCELYRNLRLTRCALMIAEQRRTKIAGPEDDLVCLLREDIGPRLDAQIDTGRQLLAHLESLRAQSALASSEEAAPQGQEEPASVAGGEEAGAV